MRILAKTWEMNTYLSIYVPRLITRIGVRDTESYGEACRHSRLQGLWHAVIKYDCAIIANLTYSVLPRYGTEFNFTNRISYSRPKKPNQAVNDDL